MRSVLRKEMKLSASPLAYFFIVFGLMFFLPGYPVLCGAFFTTLGLYQSFQYAREANDVVFSVLLPVAKKDVVKGRFMFSCFIEICALAVMFVAVLIRMTALKDSDVYKSNALMNANFFALGIAFVIFGVFNWMFIRGFYKTAYNTGKPFIIYIIVCFGIIGIAEAAHYVPGLGVLNSFGTDSLGMQIMCLLSGMLFYIILTMVSCAASCRSFELIDL